MKHAHRAMATVALVLIAAGAAFFGSRFLLLRNRPPEWVRGLQIERIDIETLETISLPHGRWETLGKVGDKFPRYKNPKTGRYTMVDVMTCSSCGQKIPVFIPPEGETNPDRILTLALQYKCPRCGARAAVEGPP